jgi:hypothetical protein
MKSWYHHGPEGPPRLTSGGDDELFEPKLIDVAPTPFFTGFDGTGDGMLRRPEMPDGMLVFRRVAAADVTALHAHPELQPCVACHDTVIAIRTARPHVTNTIAVRARHWVFRQHHDDGKVRSPFLDVESNDVMRFMLQIDSARRPTIARRPLANGSPAGARTIVARRSSINPSRTHSSAADG